ncbi:MAG: dienelactone hydrolase family protein [Alphaproteobacteria bacterium]|nr:dienelactone hydrolase family protein [Alphaproteobacteria bacterium]
MLGPLKTMLPAGWPSARDDWTPPEQCERFRSAGAPVSVTVYPDAAHSFDVGLPVHRYLGKLVGYDDAATRNSRNAMLAFFGAEGRATELADAGTRGAGAADGPRRARSSRQGGTRAQHN